MTPRGMTAERTFRPLYNSITELKEIIQQQSSIITDQNNGVERLETELVEIKAEQWNIKSQNSELQEEVRSLRTQSDSYSASLPSTRSWASVVAQRKLNTINDQPVTDHRQWPGESRTQMPSS
ncbi:hypothetical protein LTR47_011951 [Exophiala xenobiotica]|nr:hypothetical protein LTR47_011951 [Exophiala xenobiotica]KAK5277820.1 hypothetical protein LTR40_009927 [Exophiala xenobiotica]KAK5353022.1 hypothetical protein LTR11_011954 [Exophiala xenobiotica]